MHFFVFMYAVTSNNPNASNKMAIPRDLRCFGSVSLGASTSITTPYLQQFYSDENVNYLADQALVHGIRARPSAATVRASMHDAAWFYATPYHQGSAPMLDPDFGRHNEPGVQQRNLTNLNARTVRILTDSMSDNAMFENYWEYMQSTQKGDRLVHYPQFTHFHPTYAGSARFLPQ